MIKLEDIYNDYIVNENNINRKKYKKYKGFYSASSAGSCFKKQYYHIEDTERDDIDLRINRVLRLGTVIHKDIQEAVKNYGWGIATSKNRYSNFEATDKDSSADSQMLETKIRIFMEHKIEIPELNVVGHLDIAVIVEHPDGNTIGYLMDIKTSHSWQWRKRFGLRKNRDPNPSTNYELQLGTYGIGLTSQYVLDEINLSLEWYKKDNSAFKTVKINSDNWMSSALEYWTNLNEVHEDVQDIDDLVPWVSSMVPAHGSKDNPWECNYCPYKSKCKPEEGV